MKGLTRRRGKPTKNSSSTVPFLKSSGPVTFAAKVL